MKKPPENLATNSLDAMLSFNGERFDPVLGNYHLGNGYRMYSPALRRFTAPDDMSPFGKGGINGSVALTTPGQQKSRCRFFRLPTDKTVLPGTNRPPAVTPIGLYATCGAARCRPAASVHGETI